MRELEDELGKLDELNDELEELFCWRMSWLSWMLKDELGKLDEFKDELAKLGEMDEPGKMDVLKDEMDELLS